VTQPKLPDHADAAASVLEKAAKRIRAGKNVEDIADDLLPVIRIMARKV
jgi:hypothetical protein